MANAGRILIMPKGEYNPTTTYEMLDLVSHNGTSWLAKKTVVGIEPSAEQNEYWQHMFNVSAEDVSKLKEDVSRQETDKLSVERTVHSREESYFCESYKYSDGRMVINMRYDTLVDIKNESGGIFFGAVDQKEFPIPFLDKPTVVYSCEAVDGNAFVWGRGQASPTHTPYLYAGRGSKAEQTSITIVLRADGRWK